LALNAPNCILGRAPAGNVSVGCKCPTSVKRNQIWLFPNVMYCTLPCSRLYILRDFFTFYFGGVSTPKRPASYVTASVETRVAQFTSLLQLASAFARIRVM